MSCLVHWCRFYYVFTKYCRIVSYVGTETIWVVTRGLNLFCAYIGDLSWSIRMIILKFLFLNHLVAYQMNILSGVFVRPSIGTQPLYMYRQIACVSDIEVLY